MDSDLNIVSYNCRGLSLTPTLKNIQNFHVDRLLSMGDIICLQETWLWQHEVKNLNNLSVDFFGTGESSRNAEDGIFSGHPPGGVAILWKRNIDKYVSVLNLRDH